MGDQSIDFSSRSPSRAGMIPASSRTIVSRLRARSYRRSMLLIAFSLIGIALMNQFNELMNLSSSPEVKQTSVDYFHLMLSSTTPPMTAPTTTMRPSHGKTHGDETRQIMQQRQRRQHYRPLTGYRYDSLIQSGNNQSSPLMPLLVFSERNPDCVCDLVSVDCLHMLECDVTLYTSPQHGSLELARRIRQVIRETTHFPSKIGSPQYYDTAMMGWAPVGKTIQYLTIETFKAWIKHNRLPVAMNPNDDSPFCNHTWYDECVRGGIRGKACFFRNINIQDELEGNTTVLSIEEINDVPSKSHIQDDLERFRQQATTVIRTSASFPPVAYLLSFAHILRLRFEPRSFVHRIYQQRLVRVVHVNATTTQSTKLRVSLHLRRADACLHAQEGYESSGSFLDSPAQTSNRRKCYATAVYMNALQRVHALVASRNTTMDVYLSTDHAGSVMEEIRTDFYDIYRQMNWYYLNYADSETFNYQGMIEIDASSDKQAMLGESAVEDLLHMSHGQVFIGHLGSRFGKVSWLLMTARYSRFVPFFTPDGHSVCCEIDEACEEVKPFITDMENCLTFSHELAHDIPMNAAPEGYWEVGSRKRRFFVEKQRERANKHQ